MCCATAQGTKIAYLLYDCHQPEKKTWKSLDRCSVFNVSNTKNELISIKKKKIQATEEILPPGPRISKDGTGETISDEIDSNLSVQQGSIPHLFILYEHK